MSETMQEFFEKMAATLPADATREQLEEAVANWRTCRAKRLELNRLMEAMKDFETGFKSWVIEVFRQQKQEGVVKEGRITALHSSKQPVVSDKEELLKHIRNTGELDLLQFRLSTGSVDERNKEGISVPGTEYIDIYDLTDKKA